ncbi:hypothetical protein FM104_01095 [Microbacterium esteraromaticum]|uniref:Uncharacterized protein n=1 Tax=Microbacterium esteraromaticum TaxID=57043 RepID=A0A1R4IAL3_9MICO|nr:hypothetical protein FM104_01095 [Microbacterium esteraromaticum]
MLDDRVRAFRDMRAYVHADRSPRARICLINVGYEPVNPNRASSSNSVTATDAGSSESLAET